MGIRAFDMAEFLTSEERIKALKKEAFANGDPGLIANAQNEITRARIRHKLTMLISEPVDSTPKLDAQLKPMQES